MVDTDKQLSDLKKEIVEARNLVIKNDNLLKNVHADVKVVIKKQADFERRARWSSVTAYITFAALAAVGAFKFAAVEVHATTEELVSARADKKTSEEATAKMKAKQEDTEHASKRALDVFERLAGDDESQRNIALGDLAHLDTKKLSPLEARALEDKSRTLKLEAARAALDAGKGAMNRRDWRAADDALTRYLTLTSKADDQAYLLLGTARHALRNYKDAVEPLRTFLKNVPSSKQGDYATMLLGEALAESGDLKQAAEVYKAGGDKYIQSQFVMMMRNRAHRLEKQVKDSEKQPTTALPLPHATP